jgi:hypothetical protein
MHGSDEEINFPQRRSWAWPAIFPSEKMCALIKDVRRERGPTSNQLSEPIPKRPVKKKKKK